MILIGTTCDCVAWVASRPQRDYVDLLLRDADVLWAPVGRITLRSLRRGPARLLAPETFTSPRATSAAAVCAPAA